MVPLIERNRAAGPQPNTFIDPLRDVVVFDPGFSQVEAVSIGFEDVFVAGHDCAVRRRWIDPGRQRVAVVVGDRRIVGAECASAGAVAVEAGGVARELHEALAVEACRLTDPSRRQGRPRSVDLGLLRT